MFNSTHTLVGFAVGRTGMDRWAPYGIWTAVIAANLPDIDIVAQFWGTTAYIDHHRGITHAIAGVPFMALALAAVMHRIAGRRGKPGNSFQRHFWIAFIAASTHPLLDYTNVYGLRPYLPFDSAWYYGDTLFIIDPYADMVLLACALWGRYARNRRSHIAWLSLGLVLLYVGGRVELRNRAQQYLIALTDTLPQVNHSFVSPGMLNPLVWTGMVSTPGEVFRVSIDVTGAGVTGERSSIATTPDSAVVQAAAQSRSGRVFYGFARLPVTRVERVNSGYRVLLIDFRFYMPRSGTAFGAEIILDDSLQVVEESMSFTQPVPL